MDLEPFFAIEKKYGLLEENIDGFFFWIYARAEVCWYIRDRIYKHDAAFPQEKKTFIQKSVLRAKMIYNAMFHGYKKRGKYDVIVLNSPRKVWAGNYFECIYTDDIVKELKSAVVLEQLVDQKHYKPVNTPNLFYLDNLEALSQLRYYFYKFFKKKQFAAIENQIYGKMNEPLQQFALAYGVEINCNDIINIMMPKLYKYQSMKNIYNRMIRRIMPKVILEVNSDAMHCMVMTEVAKEHEIPVVELQHGIMGQEHIVYNYPPNVAIKQFPDYLFVFSDFWKLGNGCPIPDKNIIPVGFPYLEKQKSKYPPNKESGKTVLLFLSQGMVSKQFAQMAIELVDSLNMDNYKIVFKLHPGEYSTWKERIGELQGIKGIEVIDNSEKSIYEFLAMADVQIGYISTAIYEGLSYNLDTFIYTQSHNPEMGALIRLGYAREFTSGRELIQLINDREQKSSESKKPEGFWTSNALNNIKENLNRLIDGK